MFPWILAGTPLGDASVMTRLILLGYDRIAEFKSIGLTFEEVGVLSTTLLYTREALRDDRTKQLDLNPRSGGD